MCLPMLLWEKGQRFVRAQIRLRTCRPTLVCAQKCVCVTFDPSVTATLCIHVTTVKWACPPQSGENERELENKKERQASEVQQSAVSTNVGMKRHTYRHMFRNTHTHTQQVDTKPHAHKFHFCLVWQHSWNTSALRLRFMCRSGHTHTLILVKKTCHFQLKLEIIQSGKLTQHWGPLTYYS